MAPFEDEELNVQIIEKNTEQLQTRNDNSEQQNVNQEMEKKQEETKVAEENKVEENQEEEEEKKVEEEKPKARPNFPIVIKRNPVKIPSEQES